MALTGAYHKCIIFDPCFTNAVGRGFCILKEGHMSNWIDGAMVIGYIIIMFIIGIIIYKKGKNYDEYLIAGRKFNAFHPIRAFAVG